MMAAFIRERWSERERGPFNRSLRCSVDRIWWLLDVVRGGGFNAEERDDAH